MATTRESWVVEPPPAPAEDGERETEGGERERRAPPPSPTAPEREEEGEERDGGDAAAATHALLELQDFSLGRKLGRGRFGHVFLVTHVRSQRELAMKVIAKREIEDHRVTHQLTFEIEQQHRLRHKYILRLRAWFQDNKRVYIIQDLCPNGSMYTHLRKLGSFPEPVAAKYVRQLTEALVYVHSHGIIHRDIKPENLLLDAEENLKLTDFGWCVEIGNDAASRRETVCGTPDYLPPEMIALAPYGKECDIWTLGVLLYELVAGHPPFRADRPGEKFNLIRSGQYEPCPDTMSANAQDLVAKCLVVEQAGRITIGQAFFHPFVQEADPAYPGVLHLYAANDGGSSKDETTTMAATEPPVDEAATPPPTKQQPEHASTTQEPVAAETENTQQHTHTPVTESEQLCEVPL